MCSNPIPHDIYTISIRCNTFITYHFRILLCNGGNRLRGCRAGWRPFAAVGSQLGMPGHSARNRSSSPSGARSCMVTVTVLTSASPERIGTALIGIRMLRPSRTGSSTCAARSVPAFPGFSRITSRPSSKRDAGALRSSTAERTRRAQCAVLPPRPAGFPGPRALLCAPGRISPRPCLSTATPGPDWRGRFPAQEKPCQRQKCTKTQFLTIITLSISLSSY